MSFELTSLDRKILNILQQEFPLSLQPYAWIARYLDISEYELIFRIAVLKKAGLIRRIGAILESKAMGYYSTLCACRVEEERIEEVAAIINIQPGVTHNYLRDHEYNIWFTLTCHSQEKAEEIIALLEHQTGKTILSMPTTQVYKIRVALDMGENDAI